MDDIIEFKVSLIGGLIGVIGFAVFCALFWDTPIFLIFKPILPYIICFIVLFAVMIFISYKRVKKTIHLNRTINAIYEKCSQQGKDVKYITVERDTKGNIIATEPFFVEDHPL